MGHRSQDREKLDTVEGLSMHTGPFNNILIIQVHRKATQTFIYIYPVSTQTSLPSRLPQTSQ